MFLNALPRLYIVKYTIISPSFYCFASASSLIGQKVFVTILFLTNEYFDWLSYDSVLCTNVVIHTVTGDQCINIR